MSDADPLRFSNPSTVHAPLGAYHHTVAVPPGARWLAVAGQIGMAADGALPADVSGQTKQAFENVLACLAANDMGPEHLVKLTVFLTDARFIADYRAARAQALSDAHQPASTLLIVRGLALPEHLVEVEAFAAKP